MFIQLVAATLASFHIWHDGTTTILSKEPCSSQDLTAYIKSSWNLEAFNAVTKNRDGSQVAACYGHSKESENEEFLVVVDVNDKVRMRIIYPAD